MVLVVQLQAEILAALLGYDRRVAFEASRAEQAARLAVTDAMTGVHNRRAWEAALTAAEASSDDLHPAGIVVVNLQELHAIYATVGHAAADALLFTAAVVLTEAVRKDDLLADLGSGGFAVLLADTEDLAGRALARRLEQALTGAGVAASIGLGTCRSSAGLRQAWQDAHRAAHAPQPDHEGAPEAEVAPPPVPVAPIGAAVSRPAAAMPVGLSSIDALLELARAQLGMDVAFVGEFRGDDRVVRHAASGIDLPVGAGLVQPRDQTHCQLLVDGRIPEVIADTSADPVFTGVPMTQALGMNAYVGVALHRDSGELYGTLCAFGEEAEPSLRARDAGVLRVLGGIVMQMVEQDELAGREHRQTLARLEQLYTARGPAIVYQPVMRLDGGGAVGAEALSRFPDGTPDQWFRAAAAAGAEVGVGLELRAAANAVAALPELEGFLALNLSPTAVLDAALPDLLRSLPLDRIVIEITEHHEVHDYLELTGILAPLRARGLRIAVDDAGAGFASMRHITRLHPDIIKLDVSLVRDIDVDTAAQALTSALLTFASSTAAQVLAEGVETRAELACLRRLGVPLGQGYYLGRPTPHPYAGPASRPLTGSHRLRVVLPLAEQ